MKIVCLSILLLLLVIETNCLKKNHLRSQTKEDLTGDQLQTQLFELINTFRKENNKTPQLTLDKELYTKSQAGLKDMIQNIGHFHDHIGFEDRIQNPKYELYGEVLVKTTSKYDIAKKEIGAELLKDYNLAGIACEQQKEGWLCAVELAKYF